MNSLARVIKPENRDIELDQQKLYTSIINSSDYGIISKTLDGIITSWNPGAERLFGYMAYEVIGKNVSILIPPNSLNEEPAIIEKIKRGEHVEYFGTERIRKDGIIVYISLSVSPIKDENDNIIAASKIVHDISQQIEAKKKLLKITRLYLFLSEINQTIAHQHDELALFKKVCEIAAEFGKFEMAWIGIPDETNKTINLVGHGNGLAADLERFSHLSYDMSGPTASVLQSGKYFLCNDLQNEPDNGIEWREYKKTRFHSFILLPIERSGKTIGTLNIFSTIAFFFDTEETKRLVEAAEDISYALDTFEKEKQLIQSESRLKEAQKMAHLGDWEYDMATGKVQWSDEYFRIFGFEPQSVIPSLDLINKSTHTDDLEMVNTEIAKSMATMSPFAFFHRIIRPDGTHHRIFATGRFELNNTGGPVRLYGTALDVTEIAEKELKLKQLNKELELFIYRSSHDIRGPLASILGLVNLAIAELKEPEPLDYFYSIHELAERLDNILKKLMYIMSMRHEQPIIEVIDIDGMVLEIVNMLKYMDGFDKVRFSLNNHLTAPFYSEKESIFSILLNLFENAVKYRKSTVPMSDVNITILNDSKKNVLMEITDNGIGIPSSSKDKIFDMFFRGTNRVQGYGLGLYLVKTIVEKLGGTIDFNSQEGQGSVFTLKLPGKTIN